MKKGELVTLLGSNGAGKTTTLHAISGLLHLKKGKITYLDKDITHKTPYNIVHMGILQVPEGRHIFPHLTVRENLIMGSLARRNHNDPLEKDLDYIYSLFPLLKERLSQKAGTLSGGEQQMLVIGRALIGKPDLLLLDEPSLGLAPILVKEIFGAIKAIRESGTTVLLVEQNANQALEIANRGYVLENGKIILKGTAKELMHNESVRKAYLGG